MNFSKTNKSGRIGFARCLAFFVLFSIYLGCLPIFGFQTVKSSGLVFCPLMKKWVPDGSSSQPKKDQSLAEICAPNKIKKAFFEEFAKDFRFLRNTFNFNQTEDLFFSYVQKGKYAFAEIGGFPKLPEPQFLQSAAVDKSLVNRQKDFSERTSERFVLEQLARPPTIASKPLFETSAVRELRSVSRRIQPRAPPAFVS